MKISYSLLLIIFTSLSALGQSVTILFDNKPSYVNVSKAGLKYNKDFALSFTYDDGLASPVELSFALQNGGNATDGINYSGLFYTDGCGNDIPFTSGLAYYSLASNSVDLHSGLHPKYFSWNQLVDVYNSGWDAINHQFSGNGQAGISQVVDNKDYTFVQTSALGTPINLTHFVVPAGQRGWIGPAFKSGVKSVHNASDGLDDYQFSNGGCWQCSSGGRLGLKVDTITSVKDLLLTRENRDHNDPYPWVTSYIDQVAAKSTNGEKYWFSEFTHGVGIGGTGGAYDWYDMKSYLQYVESTYGKSGSDRILYASVQETWEYLHMKSKTNISSSLNDQYLTIDLDTSQCDHDLRRYHLTLLIDSDQDFSVVSLNGIEKYSAKTSGNDKIINLFVNSSVHHNPNKSLSISNTNREKMIDNIYLTENTLKIRFNYSSMKKIKLFDLNGKITFISTSSQLIFEQNLNLTNGVYFYEIIDLERGTIEKDKFISFK